MSAGIAGLNLVIAAAGLVLCSMCFVQALSDHRADPTMRKHYMAIFAVLIAYMFFDLTILSISNFWGYVAIGVHRAFILLELTVPSLATLLLLSFILYSSGVRDRYRSAAFRIAAILLLVYFAMAIYSSFTDTFYFIDETNALQRNPLYPVLIAPLVLIMALEIAVFYRRRQVLSPRQRSVIALYLLVPTISMVCQMIFYGLHAIVLGATISAAVAYVNIQRDNQERLYQSEAENARLKSEIMLSQLQPHFLCNTLGAIGGLCKNDLEAKRAITEFSRYLRENIDAVSQDAPVPFERELEHARTYLMLEQLRFGDDLEVAYDIECTEFLIPTLTLQPLVENAVRHGIRGTEDGTGTVTIASREHQDCWEIAVVDDGIGFNPEMPLTNDGQTHVGLSNVRERLRLVSNGSLYIKSEFGRGSMVSVTIPKGNYT